MRPSFWIKRFAIAFAIAFVVLAAVQALKGKPLDVALTFALAWGLVSAGVFTLAGYLRYRRNPACMLPRERTAKGRVD
ncbi:MAG TPA: hypothetical protein VIZ64_04795 [Dokdonella sp.]